MEDYIILIIVIIIFGIIDIYSNKFKKKAEHALSTGSRSATPNMGGFLNKFSGYQDTTQTVLPGHRQVYGNKKPSPPPPPPPPPPSSYFNKINDPGMCCEYDKNTDSCKVAKSKHTMSDIDLNTCFNNCKNDKNCKGISFTNIESKPMKNLCREFTNSVNTIDKKVRDPKYTTNCYIKK